MDTVLHPCSAPAAASALAGSARMTPAELQQRLSWLPALPQAALKALEALHDDVLDLPQCAEPLARDTALAACTLRLANSSFYGVQGRITQVQDALAILGRRTTANLVATVWRGREKLHFLNPVPLQEIYERWIAKFEKPRLRAIAELKKKMEKANG